MIFRIWIAALLVVIVDAHNWFSGTPWGFAIQGVAIGLFVIDIPAYVATEAMKRSKAAREAKGRREELVASIDAKGKTPEEIIKEITKKIEEHQENQKGENKD